MAKIAHIPEPSTHLRDSGKTEFSGPVEPSDEESEQVHLRLKRRHAMLLRRIAARRCQTVSGAVAYLIEAEVRRVGRVNSGG
jgi:hypothetical protein